MVFILGSASGLSLSAIKFKIPDDTYTLQLKGDASGIIPGSLTLTPEKLEKVRSLHFDEALYFCLISFSTTGYGDITPVTRTGRLFCTWYTFTTILFIFIGIPYSVSKKINVEKIRA
ncbi:two pore domain potassium channel family protein [Alteromonadaceae bacterium M269]|nr:two pore domain potassium channel family protein [Alteromonadaceae bacterium M269]